MKLKNKIISYFVVPPFQKEGVRVVRSKFMIDPEEVKPMLAEKFKKAKEGVLPPGSILQVCFDVDSKMIYVPNAPEFTYGKYTEMLDAVKYRIAKDFGDFAIRPPIAGNPFESLRVRSLESFVQAKKVISEYFMGENYDIPIIEANLSQMPYTVSCLPEKYANKTSIWGSYIGEEVADIITFKEGHTILHTQKTPFVLINTSNTRGATEKEWVVLDAYHEHSKVVERDCDSATESEWMKEDSVLYAIKRLLYMGWSFEEVCADFLSTSDNIADLCRGIAGLMLAPSEKTCFPYYISFAIDDDFPISLENIWDKKTGRIDTDKQFHYLKVIDYDLANSHVIIETPAYIPEQICKKVFDIKGSIFIAKYNPRSNTIDIKAGSKSKGDKKQISKIGNLIGRELSREDDASVIFSDSLRARGVWANSSLVFNVKRVSDYGYAKDFIKEMCTDNGVRFKDFDVVAGPIEQLFGKGVQGGFMDLPIFEQNEMSIPFQLTEDIFISPPVIFVNSVEYPSYPEQTEVLIHEYRHYIYGIMNPNYKLEYKLSKGMDYQAWCAYLTDPNEREAHTSEIKFELQLGKSFDEVIRNKVGGVITMGNYPIAVKFSELVREVMDNIEAEEELI